MTDASARPADPSPSASLEEHATELLVPVHDGMTTPWALAERVRRSPDGGLIARKSPLGRRWREMSASAFRTQVREVAAGLVARGLQPGDAIGIMSHTSYEWTLLDFAAWEAGLVVVPVYETSSAEQAQWILTDAGVKLIVVENEAMASMVGALTSTVPELESLQVLCIEREDVLGLIRAGRGVDAGELDRRSAALTSQSLATIVYTSGTTGNPKGVEVTHRMAAGLAWNGVRWIPDLLFSPDTRLLLFLPLAHSYARCLELLSIAGNGVLGHTPDVATLLPDLKGFGPSYVLAVPRVLEKIYNAADAKAGGGFRLKTFRWAAKVAIEYSRALDTPEGPSRGLTAAHALADRLVYRTIRDLLGPNARYAISGGGPLGERLGHFYRGLGLIILEGYGLTETIGPLSVNLDWRNKIGTVGPPVCGSRARVGADGEIEVRGMSVFSRYHNNPAANAEAFTPDGWFRTGDIGSIDPDGWIRITGRKKELIVTAGGKNVAPAILEDRLRGHPLISQVVVVGDKRPFIAALITLDAEMLPGWLRNHGLPPMTAPEAASDPSVLAALDRAVARTNAHVSRAESIRRITVLNGDFTEANGLLTPSLKVKRAVAVERFADRIDELYGGPVRAADTTAPEDRGSAASATNSAGS